MDVKGKILALLEVFLVRGVIIGLGIWLAFTPLTTWQQDNLSRIFSVHTLFILVPVIWLWITKRDFSEYGISFRNLKGDWRTAMSAFLPVAIGGAVLGFVPFTRWDGALIMCVVQIGVLFWVARSLTKKPDPASGVLTIMLSLVLFGVYGWIQGTYPKPFGAVTGFIFYLVFVGFGEELLNRGYVLTRLNQAFGRPYEFYGVSWGWGAVISAALFGLSHLLNGLNLETGEFIPMWWWGLWTFFGAFVFTYIREKSGSILPAAIVHGLPQALLALIITSV